MSRPVFSEISFFNLGVFILLGLTGCGASLDPLNRYLPTQGESFCEDANEAVDFALSHHLLKSEKDRAGLYRAAIQRSLADIGVLPEASANSGKEKKLIQQLQFKNSQDDLEALQSCRHMALLSEYIRSINEAPQNEDTNESPVGFYLFLSNFSSELDSFSRFELPRLRDQEARLSFGFGVDLHLPKYYGVKPSKTLISHTQNSDLELGEQIVSLKIPTGNPNPLSKIVDTNSEVFLNALSASNYFFILQYLINQPSPVRELELKSIDLQNSVQNKVVSASTRIKNPVFYEKILGEEAIYLKVTQFYDGLTEDFLKAWMRIEKEYQLKFFNQTFYPDQAVRPSIILDVRWNPGGSVRELYQLADLFFDQAFLGTEVLADGSRKPIDSRLVRSNQSNQTRTLSENPGYLQNYPVIVLMNHASASSAELLAQILGSKRGSESRAIVIGEPSFGKGIYQYGKQLQKLRGTIHVTASRFFSPEGVNFQIKRFQPSIEVLDPFLENLKADCQRNPSLQCIPLTMKEREGLLVPETDELIFSPLTEDFTPTPLLLESLQPIQDQFNEAKKVSEKSDEEFDDVFEFSWLYSKALYIQAVTTRIPLTRSK